jgi:hypothetical protein
VRITIWIVIALAVLAGAWWRFSQREPPFPAAVVTTQPTPPARVAEPAPVDTKAKTSSGGFDPQSFPLVARLNAADSTIVEDIAAVRQTLEAWRTNFPREGNPVGENSEITAALLGANRLNLVLIPRHHPAVSAAGELCDRWGTPFRFHPLSGEVMEIVSAGPDRRFGTPDDAQWSP